MRLKHLSIALAIVFPFGAASGEVLAPSEQYGLGEPSLAGALVIHAPDVSKFIAEDGKRAGGPYRYGVAVPTAGFIVAKGRTSFGTLSRLADGRVLWRAVVAAPGAKSIDFEFSRLSLPEGAAMYFSNAEFEVVRGPITAADLDVEPGYYSPFVPGDVAYIEIVAPRRSFRHVELELASVTHGYRGLFESGGGLDKSGSCNVDVACPLGAGWADQIASVGHYTFRRGASSYVCTGQLVANTRRDSTPFFLTANHCLSSSTAASSVVVYWNYQSSTCRTPGSSASGSPLPKTIASHTQSGSTLVATNAASDFTLLRLSTAVPSGANAFWSGWDRRDYTPGGAIAIHHPSGHEKRISEEVDPLSISRYSGAPGSGTTHLRVADWDQGTTEGGSSGSGLWDRSSKLLVGQLHGGGAACGNNEPDWYGRFFVSWTGGGTSSTRLSTHLDPAGTGATQLAGYRPTTTPPGPFFQNTTDYAIRDNSTVESPISVTGVSGNAPSALRVGVNIVHTYIGDLKVDLIAPNGTVFVLHNRTGGSTDNINTTYTVNASGVLAAGTWRLRVNDNAAGDTGYIDAWSLQF